MSLGLLLNSGDAFRSLLKLEKKTDVSHEDLGGLMTSYHNGILYVRQILTCVRKETSPINSSYTQYRLFLCEVETKAVETAEKRASNTTDSKRLVWTFRRY